MKQQLTNPSRKTRYVTFLYGKYHRLLELIVLVDLEHVAMFHRAVILPSSSRICSLSQANFSRDDS